MLAEGSDASGASTTRELDEQSGGRIGAGIARPGASDVLRAHAELMQEIAAIVKKNRWTQTEAAQLR